MMVTVMNVTKPVLAALVAASLPVAGAAAPATNGAALDPLVRTFATCTGRLSALMEHQWLMGLDGSEYTQKRRNQMATLLEAVMRPGPGPQVLALRIEAKFALAQLFSRMTFGRDAQDVAWAANRVEVELAACDGLLLG